MYNQIKQILRTIAGVGLIAVMYVIFVADRVITAPFPRHQLSFKSWADLNLKEDERRFLSLWDSVVRVVGGAIVVFLIWLFM